MFRTLQAISIANSAISTADGLERRHGKRGRLLILVLLPAQMVAASLVLSLVARVLAPIRRLRGLPAHPGAERVAAVWTALLLENALVSKTSRSMPKPASAVLGSMQTGKPNAAALGPLLPVGTVLVVGSLAGLPEAELRAALAHELGHLRLRHTIALSFALAAIAAGWPLLVRRFIPDHARTATAVSVLSGALILSAVQRFFEAAADDYSVDATGNPGSLADALESLEAARVASVAAQTGLRARLRHAMSEQMAGRLALRLNTFLDENVFGSHPVITSRIKGLRRRAARA